MNGPAAVVLVHGAWHGGWCWARVLGALRIAGVHAMALTLTGLGERAHPISPEVGLDTHVRDIVAVIECEELESVVLVGHSYAGILLGGAAERVGGRARGLVYVDGLIPGRGDSALELFPTQVADAMAEGARRAGGWRLPPWPAASFGVTDPADRQWVDRRLTDHPYATLRQRAPSRLRPEFRDPSSPARPGCATPTCGSPRPLARIRAGTTSSWPPGTTRWSRLRASSPSSSSGRRPASS